MCCEGPHAPIVLDNGQRTIRVTTRGNEVKKKPYLNINTRVWPKPLPTPLSTSRTVFYILSLNGAGTPFCYC